MGLIMVQKAPEKKRRKLPENALKRGDKYLMECIFGKEVSDSENFFLCRIPRRRQGCPVRTQIEDYIHLVAMRRLSTVGAMAGQMFSKKQNSRKRPLAHTRVAQRTAVRR